MAKAWYPKCLLTLSKSGMRGASPGRLINTCFAFSMFVLTIKSPNMPHPDRVSKCSCSKLTRNPKKKSSSESSIHHRKSSLYTALSVPATTSERNLHERNICLDAFSLQFNCSAWRQLLVNTCYWLLNERWSQMREKPYVRWPFMLLARS